MKVEERKKEEREGRSGEKKRREGSRRGGTDNDSTEVKKIKNGSDSTVEQYRIEKRKGAEKM